MPLTLGALAAQREVVVRGDPGIWIHRLASLEHAGPDALAFCESERYLDLLKQTKAGAVLLTPALSEHYSGPALIHAQPRWIFSQIAQQFDQRYTHEKPGIHPTAVIDASAQVDPSALIGPYAVVEADAVIGPQVVIGAHSYVGRSVILGAQTRLHPHVVIACDSRLGERVILHSHAVVGSDGFGFVPDPQGHWAAIPQLGGVVLESDVVVGAHTTIDRGALEPTWIERGVILDNHIQIAHNVRVGAWTAMAACVGIAGSTKIGKRCLIGGGAGIAGHITLADGVQITGMTLVTRSIHQAGLYSSGIPAKPNALWLRNASRFHELDALAQRVKQLEKVLQSQGFE